MKLLWVTSSRVGSKIVRWGLDTDCSHFAICFDEGQVEEPFAEIAKGIAFHSYGSGTQLEWLKTFLCKNYVVHAIEPVKALTLEEEESVYKAILESESDRRYDYPAFFWFGWRAFLYKVLGWDIAGINRWQRPEARLCTGIAPAVLKALGTGLFVGNVELVKPHDLFELLLKSGDFKLAEDWAREARLCHESATSTLLPYDVVS